MGDTADAWRIHLEVVEVDGAFAAIHLHCALARMSACACVIAGLASHPTCSRDIRTVFTTKEVGQGTAWGCRWSMDCGGHGGAIWWRVRWARGQRLCSISPGSWGAWLTRG